eukprot:TRINITY_DN17900_c1_g3_i1.p1 TRINITY_DN17900_c1_g3~~TRINITY_DN17900_c1_g3_i1.p1  ORF type:complete len:159 (-),score=39.01 TRINITY_DN17900_c1_g3_i1:132-608(-)
MEKLSSRAWEVIGLIRLDMSNENSLREVDLRLSSAKEFLVTELPQAGEKMKLKPLGLVFQALLLHGGGGRSSSTTKGDSESRSACLLKTFGQAKADRLAAAALDLCQLIRVKVEDDGDLALARRVMEDCCRFFRALGMIAERREVEPFKLLQEVLLKM